MKLKEFLKGHGFLQHLVCFLLWVLEITMLVMLMAMFPEHEDLVIIGTILVFSPVTFWMLLLIISDIAVIGRWLWRLILPEKLRGSMEKVMKKEVFRMGEDAIVKGIVDKEYYLRKNGQYERIDMNQVRQLMADWQRTAEWQKTGETEIKIFRMWDDAVVWKDGQLQLRKNGEYTPITIEQARKQERGYHRYQMSMDVNRGGLPDEVAQRARGFDSDGNYVGGYAVDEFWKKRFGHVEAEKKAAAKPVEKPAVAEKPAAKPQPVIDDDSITWCAAYAAVVRSRAEAARKRAEQEAEPEKKAVEATEAKPVEKPAAAENPAAKPARTETSKSGVKDETEIFRMWDDAVVWKDGQLQLRKNGEYTPITIEQARKQESGYHFYQMTQDIQRGGAPEDVARANRGFDRNGNFVGGYAVDEFWMKHFGYAPQDEQEITVTRCMRCGKKLDEPMKAKKDSYIRCRECMGDDQVKSAEEKSAEMKCARCGKFVKQDEVTVREGAAYCASCVSRLKIKPKAKEEPNEIRCARCGKRLKAGEVVSRGGVPYCKKCGDMPDAAKDQPVFETPHWSVVWNDGKLYKYSKHDGYQRIALYQARELEREHMLGMWLSCLERGLMNEEKANETYRIKDGKYAGPYAVDALTDGRSGTAIFPLYADSVIWKDGGVHHLRSTGECQPITMDEARKLEFDYWNDMAARAYREAETERFEYAQSKIVETKNGFRLKEYAVDEFMRKQQAAGVRSEATDDQPGTKICDLYHGELIWKDGGLHFQKYQGECTPVTREKAQEIERLDWSYNADHIYRMGASMEHVRLVEGFDENGNRTRTYAVDEFMKRRAEAVCTRCGAKHYAPLEDLIAPDFGCKSCGNPVKVRKVDKEFSPTDIVVDGLIYRRIYAGMILIGSEIGTKEAVVRSHVNDIPPVRIVEGVVLSCENDVPLVRIALREYDPGLKLTFEPGFRIDFRSDDYSEDMKQYGIGSLSNLPGFTRETVKDIAHHYNPDIVQEVVHRSETQTIREKFEYHGFDAVYTMELE